jgi:hypothetical protein
VILVETKQLSYRARQKIEHARAVSEQQIEVTITTKIIEVFIETSIVPR